MSAPKCLLLLVFITQLVDNLIICMPVDENKNGQPLMSYHYDNPYFRGGQIDGHFGGSNWGGHRPNPSGPPVPGSDGSVNVPIGTGYLPPPGATLPPPPPSGFDNGFDGNRFKPGVSGTGGGTGLGGTSGGFDNGFNGGGFGPHGIIGGFDTGFDGSGLGGRPSGGFDGGFDGSNLGRPGGSLVQQPNFDVRSG